MRRLRRAVALLLPCPGGRRTRVPAPLSSADYWRSILSYRSAHGGPARAAETSRQLRLRGYRASSDVWTQSSGSDGTVASGSALRSWAVANSRSRMRTASDRESPVAEPLRPPHALNPCRAGGPRSEERRVGKE